MRFLLFLTVLLPSLSTGQTVLFEEDFDDCSGTNATWTVDLQGNPDFVWYVGFPTNPSSDSSSIDGTCMFIMDDDATGEDTDAIIADFKSPVFDARGYINVFLNVDISYRDYDAIDETFDIILFDGQTEYTIAHFEDTDQTGTQFSDFRHLKVDLSLYSQTETMQVILRYDDAGGGWGWYCGFDNIRITGEGQGEPVIVETFDDCALPIGWTTEILQGEDDWMFSNPPSTHYAANASMNGSCFVLFDDDFLGDSADVSTLRLMSPWFDGRDFAAFQLDFDLILRYWQETVSIFVENGNGEMALVQSWSDDIGGPDFNNFVHQSFDISAFRHPQMRVVFEYDDGNTWSWWAGIDNVKISGHGEAFDICNNAIPLFSNEDCMQSSNKTAIFEGPIPTCSEVNTSGIWYTWTADFSGNAKIEIQSDFNDVVSVFSGTCSDLAWVTCGNRDSYGFEGEYSYFQAQQGTPYRIRISGGETEGFGRSRGDFCIKISQEAPSTKPVNNPCQAAIPLSINANCTLGNNEHADALLPDPSQNLRADADVWYQFTAPLLATDEFLRLTSEADFSDVLAVYSGTCSDALELQSTAYGQSLDVYDLVAGEVYFVQVSGNFATIEGDFCLKASIESESDTPSNDACDQATLLILDADCTNGTLKNSSFSGIYPPCIVDTKRDVWYQFTAPPQEIVWLNVASDFKKDIAIWDGDCTAGKALYCFENPLACDGYQKITGLTAGNTYLVQISATYSESGDFCIQLLDGQQMPPFQALQLSVQTLCVGIDSARLIVQANQGTMPYSWPANVHQQLLHSGEAFDVIVRDAMGCEQAISGIAPDCDGAVLCAMDMQIAATNPSCSDATDGTLQVSTSNAQAPFTYLWNNSGLYTDAAQDLGAGIYAVTVFDANGCSATATQSLEAPPKLLIAFDQTQNPTNGQDNGSITAVVDGGSGLLTLAWYDANGQWLSDATVLDQIGVGNYTLEVTDANGCTTSETITLQGLTKTKEAAAAAHLYFSPNPASKKTSLFLSESLGTACALTIRNSAGKIFLEQKSVNIVGNQVVLDVQGLAAGNYFVRVHCGKKVFTERLIVVR